MKQPELQRDQTVTHEIHRLFWRTMVRDPKMLALTYLGNVPAYFVLNIFIPLQVAYGMQAILAHDQARLTHQAWVVLLSSVVGTTFFAIGMWANHRVAVDGAAQVQRKVFANYLDKDYDFYASQYVGSLGSDAAALRESYREYSFMYTIHVPRLLVIIFAGLSVILYKSFLLGLVTTGCVAVVTGVTFTISRYRLKYRRDLSLASSNLAGKLTDPLSQAAAVKGFAQEVHELRRLESPLSAWRHAQIKIYDTSIPLNFIRHSLLGGIMAILLLVSGHLYFSHQITVAIVVLVQLYVVRIVLSTVEIGEHIKLFESFMGEAHEPMATMLVQTTVNDSIQPQPFDDTKLGSIVFNAVAYHYPEASKGTMAVQDFSLDISPGEKVGLVGFSGGGKTTITKLLLRFMDTTQGSIAINGAAIQNLSQTELRRAIAYVPQEPLLFHRSIKDNIAYARPNATDKEIKRAAKTAYVDEFVQEIPGNYDALVGERGVKLSGGQRQRVAIARALLKQSQILVLDEATSALDSQSEQYIQKALWELMKGKTAIVIAHRLSTIQHMDRIVVIDKGKIVQIGSHQELLKAKQGIYAKLWAHQSGGYLNEEAKS